MLGWLLEAWKAYAHRATTYQSHILLTVVYLLVLGPAALIGRAFGSRLMDVDSGPRSAWLVRPRPEKDLAALRRQF